MSLTALVTGTRGQPRGLELDGKLEEVTRDGRLYQKQGTFLLRYVWPLPLTCSVCQASASASWRVMGNGVSRAAREAHPGLRSPRWSPELGDQLPASFESPASLTPFH